MLFSKKKVKLEELPLEQVRFSSEDLFCLLGGNDACMVACGPMQLRLDIVERDRPDKDVWRRNLVNRYAPSGWVDAEGNPCPELARVIDALGQMGVAISYEQNIRKREIGVVAGEKGAAGVVKVPGFGGGWYLRPFPDDRSQWAARFREVLPASKLPFEPASREYHATVVEPEEENVAQAFAGGDEPYARAYALRHGLDPDALAEMARALGKDFDRPRIFVSDLTNCEPDLSMGWRYVGEARGHVRCRRVMLVPEIGAIFSNCSAWSPSVSESWLSENISSIRDKTDFYSFDFYRSGDLFEALSHAPAHPDAAAAGEDPGLPKSWTQH